MSDTRDIVERLRIDFSHVQRTGLASARFSKDEIGALFAEIDRLRADFAALQHALVGDTGASAILTAQRLRAASPVAPQWQPIETAPKDGTTIIAYRPSSPPHVEGMYWVAYEGMGEPGGWHWSYDGDAPTANPPTYWMPIPADPHPAQTEGR